MKLKELMERYNLKTRSALYSRLHALDMELCKDASNRNFASQDQIKQLDDLDHHLRNGGTLRTYIKPVEVTVDNGVSQPENTIEDSGQLATSPTLDTLVDTILARVLPQNPIHHHRLLEEACAYQWELRTSEIKQLIGSKPRGNNYKWGCFLFEKQPHKAGRERTWRVFKVSV